MEYVFRHLGPWLRLVLRHAWLVVLSGIAITGGSLMLARNLVIDPDFANLIPKSYPSVRAVERIRETIGAGEISVDLAVESPSFEANRQFAEALVPKALALKDSATGEAYFVRAELRRDTEFLSNNALYFATDEELDDLEQWLEDQIDQARLEANPFYFDLEDEDDSDESAEYLRDTFERIVGPEYLTNADSTILVTRFFASGSSTNIRYIEHMYQAMEGAIAEVGAGAFHSEMQTYLAGRLWRQRIELRAIVDDVLGSLGVGLLAVLLTIMAYFCYKAIQVRGRRLAGREVLRAPLTAVLIGVPLLMSLVWTAGVGYLAFGTLNLLSSTLGLVLFGLGIDYGIHFYARYIEERRGGLDPVRAAERTFMSTGQAIAVGAFTTAAALYVLVAADFKGFSQFGFLAGTGVLFALLAMLHVLPALLILCERWKLLQLDGEAGPPVRWRGRFAGARGVLVGCVLAVLVALVMARDVKFEYRFGTLEPEYPEWVAVHSKVSSAWRDFDRRNPAYIVVDDPAETPAVAAVLRDRIAADTILHVVDADTFRSTIREVETLQERFPTERDAQVDKLSRIAYIRDRLLTDPLLAAEASEDLAGLRQAAQTTAPIEEADVPELLRKRFTSKTGELGGYITIIPAVGLSDGRKSMAFAEEVSAVSLPNGKTYHAGSSSIVAADMLRLMRRESPYMVVATLVIVMLLMWVNFLRLRWALLALLPLIVGVIWMILFMRVFGMSLNFYNLVAIPAIIGIGNDAGVHLVHRYREKGKSAIMSVLRSTGEPITMGALTTMIGFGGLLLSFHPGLNSVGGLAVAGLAATLLAALVFLPALIQWLEDSGRLWNVSR